MEKKIASTQDSDGYGIGNYLDLDSDGDSISDRLEGSADADNDGVKNYLNLDSDNDGIFDLAESASQQHVQQYFDEDQDGKVDSIHFVGTNGLANILETAPDSGISSYNLVDTDLDSVQDYFDIDSDNDGKSDQSEVGGTDLDNNGVLDILNDVDFDGIPDVVDVDQTGGQDSDNDSIDDSAHADFVNNIDTNSDGIVDEFDSDADGDGLLDDGQGLSSTGEALPDSDNNGVPVYQQAQNGKVTTAMGGCSMSKNNSLIDPLLPLMFLGAILGLQRRRLRKASYSSVMTVALAISLATPFIFEDANASEFNRRLYIGANAGMSQLEPDASGIGATVSEKNDLGFGLNLGMDISNRISAEAHAHVLGKAQLSPNGEVDYSVYGLSALIYGLNDYDSRDLRENFSGFLRLGVDTMKNSASVPYELENNLSFVIGLGAEYGLYNGLAFRGEFTRFYSDAYYAGLGLLYRFGDNQGSSEKAYGAETTQALLAEEVTETPETPLLADATPVALAFDQDGDGVLDDVDQCLGSRSDLPVNEVGCNLFDGVMEGVTFESASATLTADAQKVLDSAAKDLLNYPSIRVAIMAHTDNQGDAKLNLDLSKQRVITVVRYLLGQGVPMARMRAEAYGEKRPIASNETAEGRLRNRRVEFKTIE